MDPSRAGRECFSFSDFVHSLESKMEWSQIEKKLEQDWQDAWTYFQSKGSKSVDQLTNMMFLEYVYNPLRIPDKPTEVKLKDLRDPRLVFCEHALPFSSDEVYEYYQLEPNLLLEISQQKYTIATNLLVQLGLVFSSSGKTKAMDGMLERALQMNYVQEAKSRASNKTYIYFLTHVLLIFFEYGKRDPESCVQTMPNLKLVLAELVEYWRLHKLSDLELTTEVALVLHLAKIYGLEFRFDEMIELTGDLGKALYLHYTSSAKAKKKRKRRTPNKGFSEYHSLYHLSILVRMLVNVLKNVDSKMS